MGILGFSSEVESVGTGPCGLLCHSSLEEPFATSTTCLSDLTHLIVQLSDGACSRYGVFTFILLYF